MNVVGLFRVSTDRQEDRGTSLDTQAQRYAEYIAASGHSDLKTFRGSESATQAIKDRHVLQQVLAFVRDHPVDAVWVIEQSRLSRGDELETALLMRELRERGIKIIVNGAVRDPASIDDGFMLGIQSLVDRTESLRIKERMARGRTRRAQEGKKNCGAAPFGYTNPPPGHKDRGMLQIVPDEAAVVRRVFELAAKGIGSRAVAKALNSSGIAAPKGGTWGKTSVERVLRNMAYIGVMASRAWVAEKGTRTFRYQPKNERAIIREGTHKAIVTKELWDAVHSLPKAVRTAQPRMLTELLHVNGVKYGGDKSGTIPYYRSPRGMKGKAWLDAREVDSAVWFHFTTLARSEEFVSGLMQAQSPGEKALLEQEIAFATERLGKAKRRLDRLVEMRMNDEITKDVYAAKSLVEQNSISAIEKDLAGFRARLDSTDGNHAGRIARAVRNLLYGATRLTTEQRRQVIRSIVRRVDITAEPVKADFKRDERGRVVKGATPRWRIAQVAFRLAVPPDATSARGTQPGPTWAEGAGTSAARNENHADRAGQLGTTFSSCGQPSEATDDHRTGHLATTD